MDYRRKYHKYKTKYKLLKKKIRFIEGDAYSDIVLSQSGPLKYDDDEDVVYLARSADIERDEDYIEEYPIITSIQQARPFILDYSPSEQDTISVVGIDPMKEKPSEQIDIGLFGLARGRVHNISEFNSNDFVTINNKPNEDKILRIDNLDAFDEFTERYGALGSNDEDEDNEFIYIKWNKVKDDYKGFYLNTGLSSERYSTAVYKDNTYISWWEHEYMIRLPEQNIHDEIDGVVVFEKPAYKRYKGYDIIKPFKGKIYRENDFPTETYIDIIKVPDSDKILLIDDMDSFDKFTNKYGYIHTNGIDKISIKWKMVVKDYKGIYIDKDTTIHPNRYLLAFYKGKKYGSWWKYYDIHSGIVYVFGNV